VRDQARGLLVGGRAGVASGAPSRGRSQGEQVILTKAGADKADPDIRRKVDEDAAAVIEADESFSDKILFWQSKPTPGEALDPAEEAKRLKTNASLGKPADDSAPPIIYRKQEWLPDIF
jgi:hypothetical protein